MKRKRRDGAISINENTYIDSSVSRAIRSAQLSPMTPSEADSGRTRVDLQHLSNPIHCNVLLPVVIVRLTIDHYLPRKALGKAVLEDLIRRVVGLRLGIVEGMLAEKHIVWTLNEHNSDEY